MIKQGAIRTVLHYCKCSCVFIIKTFSYLWPKDKNLVLFSSWFGQKYADNSMYLFEYMLNNSSYNVVWFTRSKTVFNQLKAERKPVVYSNSLLSVYYHLRAKVFVSTIQFFDFYAPLMSKCILLDLDHGFPAKYVHFAEPGISNRVIRYEMLLRKWVRYYMTASSFFTMSVVSKCFAIPWNNIVFSNKPRIDVFFDEKLRKGKNGFIERLKRSNKTIVWMPTHRSQGRIPIDVTTLLDLDGLQRVCEEIGAVFVIKKHFYHRNELTDLSKYTRIIDITHEELDIQTLLFQADVLISDYSSCYIEYLTMNRPVILYTYDLEDYLATERDVCVKMEENHVGYKVKDKTELNKCIKIIGDDWTDEKNSQGRNEARDLYFDKDVEMGCSCSRISSIIPLLIEGKYSFEWNHCYNNHNT